MNSGGEIFIIAIYVDGFILARKTSERIQKFINAVAEKFDIADMGKLHHFVGIKINYMKSGNICTGQPAYVRKVLKNFEMDNSKPVGTPVKIETKLRDENNMIDQELYQSAVRSLLYLLYQILHMLMEMLLVLHQNQHRYIGLQ